MKWTTTILLCVTLFAGTAAAADNAERRSHGKLWWASVAAMVGASILDTHSSWGRQELNPLLANGSGRFGGRALAIKAGVAMSVAGGQHFLLRSNPGARKIVSIANFSMAGVMGRVAMHNYTNNKPPAALPSYMAAAGSSGLR